MNAQRVYVGLHHIAQHAVYQAMALERAHAVEISRADVELEVTAAISCAGVSRMFGGLVNYLKREDAKVLVEQRRHLIDTFGSHGYQLPD